MVLVNVCGARIWLGSLANSCLPSMVSDPPLRLT